MKHQTFGTQKMRKRMRPENKATRAQKINFPMGVDNICDSGFVKQSISVQVRLSMVGQRVEDAII